METRVCRPRLLARAGTHLVGPDSHAKRIVGRSLRPPTAFTIGRLGQNEKVHMGWRRSARRDERDA